MILHHLIRGLNKAVNIPQAVLDNYKKPKPQESLWAEFIIYFMSSSSVMCTGNLTDRSHVDVVGRQRQLRLHPWTNIKDFLFEKPGTGVVLQLDIHLSKWDKVIPKQNEKKHLHI